MIDQFVIEVSPQKKKYPESDRGFLLTDDRVAHGSSQRQRMTSCRSHQKQTCLSLLEHGTAKSQYTAITGSLGMKNDTDVRPRGTGTTTLDNVLFSKTIHKFIKARLTKRSHYCEDQSRWIGGTRSAKGLRKKFRGLFVFQGKHRRSRPSCFSRRWGRSFFSMTSYVLFG